MARPGLFVCEFCERSNLRVKPFVSQSALEMHMRAKHPAKAPPRPGASARPHEPVWNESMTMKSYPPAQPRGPVARTFRWFIFFLMLALVGAAGWPFVSAYLQSDPTATHE
jgi:hypothetical protein